MKKSVSDTDFFYRPSSAFFCATKFRRSIQRLVLALIEAVEKLLGLSGVLPADCQRPWPEIRCATSRSSRASFEADSIFALAASPLNYSAASRTWP